MDHAVVTMANGTVFLFRSESRAHAFWREWASAGATYVGGLSFEDE